MFTTSGSGAPAVSRKPQIPPGLHGPDTSRYTGRHGAYLWVPAYPKVIPTVYTELQSMARSLVPRGSPIANLHITVTYSYSKAPGPRQRLTELILDSQAYLPEYQYGDADIAYWRGNGEGFIVLNIESRDLTGLHDDLVYTGVGHDYPVYTPHITLMRGVGAIDLNIIRCVDALNRRLAAVPYAQRNSRNTGSLVASDIDVWN